MTVTVRRLLYDVLKRSGVSRVNRYRKMEQYDNNLPVVWTNKHGRSFVFQYGYGIREMVEQPLTEELKQEILDDLS
jgi:hypothetical protein